MCLCSNVYVFGFKPMKASVTECQNEQSKKLVNVHQLFVHLLLSCHGRQIQIFANKRVTQARKQEIAGCISSARFTHILPN